MGMMLHRHKKKVEKSTASVEPKKVETKENVSQQRRTSRRLEKG